MDDLFNTPEALPQGVQEVLKKYAELPVNYANNDNLLEELNILGYTFEWGLDGIPHTLRPTNAINVIIQSK